MPDVIAEYFRAAAVGDTDAVVATFTHDATVVDDGHHHAGHSRIRAWRDQTSAQFSYTTTVLDSAPSGGAEHHVTTQVAGDFAGSPVRLGFRFTLAGGGAHRRAGHRTGRIALADLGGQLPDDLPQPLGDLGILPRMLAVE